MKGMVVRKVLRTNKTATYLIFNFLIADDIEYKAYVETKNKRSGERLMSIN